MAVVKAEEENKASSTIDEVSMGRSTNFITALQELKNLRPHLYSAAEYCEKSYIKSEHKKMVLDNLKDYTVRALVNAIDHLGTVAYKLSDVLEQQSLEISSIDLKITCLNLQLLTCQTYTDEEGHRQQQLLAIIPRHHKHYTLPKPSNKKVHFSQHMQKDSKQRIQVRGHLYPSGASAAKTLSWHLASETKSTLKGSSQGIMSTEESQINGKQSIGSNSLDARENTRRSIPATRLAMQTLGVIKLPDSSDNSKALTRSGPPKNPAQKAIIRAPVRNKNMLALFIKQKALSN